MQEEFVKDSERSTAVISEALQEVEARDEVQIDKETKNVKDTGKKEGISKS